MFAIERCKSAAFHMYGAKDISLLWEQPPGSAAARSRPEPST
jgi:hypothetical protein